MITEPVPAFANVQRIICHLNHRHYHLCPSNRYSLWIAFIGTV